MSKKLKLIGQKYDRLTVSEMAFMKKEGYSTRSYWKCTCRCGKQVIVRGTDLKLGKIRSCGCLRTELVIKRNKTSMLQYITKHGKTNSKIYQAWENMKQRCSNPNNGRFFTYGKRGIFVCDRWNKFENFYKDMGDVPKGKTLERIDNNKEYKKENCCWATRKEQMNNTTRNHFIKFLGKTQTLSKWVDESKISYGTLFSRLSRGWPIDRALTQNLYGRSK